MEKVNFRYSDTGEVVQFSPQEWVDNSCVGTPVFRSPITGEWREIDSIGIQMEFTRWFIHGAGEITISIHAACNAPRWMWVSLIPRTRVPKMNNSLFYGRAREFQALAVEAATPKHGGQVPVHAIWIE